MTVGAVAVIPVRRWSARHGDDVLYTVSLRYDAAPDVRGWWLESVSPAADDARQEEDIHAAAAERANELSREGWDD